MDSQYTIDSILTIPEMRSGDQVGQGGDDATDFRDLCQTGKDSVFIFYIFDSLVIPKFFQVLNKCC